MRWFPVGWLSAAAILLSTAPAPAAPPVVPGVERLIADGQGDAAHLGRVLLSELNCVACHEAKPEAAHTKKPAPLLDGVAGRAKAAYLRKFLQDPQAVKPGTTMPSLLAADTDQRREQAEALVHFLASTGPAGPPQEFATIGARQRGGKLFHQVGCAACHQPRWNDARQAGDVVIPEHIEQSPNVPASAPLGDLPAKYTLPSLARFLRDPLRVRPSGRMPSLSLSRPEAHDIAAYLLDSAEVARIRYSYFEGSWQKLPDFDALTPVAVGGAEKIDVSVRQRDERFGLRFEGYLPVPQAGRYRFHLGSDDGSRLMIDGRTVVDVDGIHAYTDRSAATELEVGSHRITIDYFELGGEERLVAEVEGPELLRQPLGRLLTSGKQPPEAELLEFTADPQLAARGAELFAELGCAACHVAHREGSPVTSRLAAPALHQLRLDRGCLQRPAPSSAARYRLSAAQAAALQAALRSPPPTDDASRIHAALTRFNCYACHARGGVGGVQERRDPLFQTTTREIGDEGRIPPRLDQVGAKLTAQWLDRTLAEGADERPYMLTRMPSFGRDNVGHLTPLLERADRQAPLDVPAFSEPLPQVKEHGRRMVGVRGFSCTQCHTFGRFSAQGLQSIDMRSMTRRLRRDWFVRYVLDPQAYRQETRMPSAWPMGRSLLKDVLQGDTQQQIAAVWAYLEDGPRAKIPAGLITESLELVPYDEAIIYRNFIEGAGPRAIGVGYPEGLHLAFDAEQCRLALLWEGRFIDATRHWSGRGQGFQPPAGENVLALPDIAPLAELPGLQSPWPAGPAGQQGWRFEGYRLGREQRPTFLYRYRGSYVEDYFDTTTSSTSAPLRRTLQLKLVEPRDPQAEVRTLYYCAARGASIRPLERGWFEIDGRWKTRLSGRAVQRDSDGQQELLLPVDFQDGRAEIKQEYAW